MNLRKIFITTIMSLAFILTSCTDEHYTVVEGGNAEIKTYFQEVSDKDWKWNADKVRYEVSYSMSEITKEVFDYEAVIPYLFDWEADLNYEVSRSLPYEKEYMLDDGTIFTERISYYISEGRITFFIEVNDMVMDEASKRFCEFKIVVVKAI